MILEDHHARTDEQYARERGIYLQYKHKYRQRSAPAPRADGVQKTRLEETCWRNFNGAGDEVGPASGVSRDHVRRPTIGAPAAPSALCPNLGENFQLHTKPSGFEVQRSSRPP